MPCGGPAEAAGLGESRAGKPANSPAGAIFRRRVPRDGFAPFFIAAPAAALTMERLRQRADFLAAATGARAPVSGFVLQALNRREDGPVRVGFTVSKKVGNSPERNRVRRRLREVVRLAPQASLRSGYDYVLIGRRTALNLPFDRLIEDFTRALNRVHAGKSTGTSLSATPHAGTR